MKQIIQDLRTGKTILEEVPAPIVRKGCVLIRTGKSLVSLGTEKMLVEFGRANLIEKARQQPDRVKQVLEKIKTDGLLPTLESVFNKLNQPIPLGYCNAGEVIEIGEGVNDLKIGDRVASNGNHAEYVCIPKNLVAKIPDNVSDEEAAFTVVGAIALQSLRLANPSLGENVVVIGLGLIGLLTAQLLHVNGCNVIGFDFDGDKVLLACSLGITGVQVREGTDPVKSILELTDNIGADAVIISASTDSNEVISQAAKMSRKRGRIILIGVIGLDISRADFYEKELSFQVSCSYGPGRYDEMYEQNGNDYPLPYVRWTENRNFETVLNLISSQQLNVKTLITEVIPLQEYNRIYDSMGHSKSIASLLTYDSIQVHQTKIQLFSSKFEKSKGVIGIIGAGNFTNAVVLPFLKKAKAQIKYISSVSGLSGTSLSKKYDIPYITTDYKEILQDPEIDLVIITTRHNLHATMVEAALFNGKHVFVEKPLCLRREEIENIVRQKKSAKKMIMVGYNRRFSSHSKIIKSLIPDQTAINIVATMNAGFIPDNMWVHDLQVGGGRIIGEACHYLDLLIFLTGSMIDSVCMNALGKSPASNTDNASILIKFENGSNGVINYFSNGNKSYSKEKLEIYFQNKILVLDNFRRTFGYGFKNFKQLKTQQDKGHANQFKMLTNMIKEGGKELIPFDEIVNSSLASFAALESLKTKKWVNV